MVEHDYVHEDDSPRPWLETWQVHSDEPAVRVDDGASLHGDRIVECDSGVYLRDVRDLHMIAAAPDMYRMLDTLTTDARTYLNASVERDIVALLKKARGEDS
jgi:hypothetical protein